MTRNEIIQFTIVAIILLLALLWIIFKLIRSGKNQNQGCSSCSLSESCKTKELKNKIVNQQAKDDCHGGRSARN